MTIKKRHVKKVLYKLPMLDPMRRFIKRNRVVFLTRTLADTMEKAAEK